MTASPAPDPSPTPSLAHDPTILADLLVRFERGGRDDLIFRAYREIAYLSGVIEAARVAEMMEASP